MANSTIPGSHVTWTFIKSLVDSYGLNLQFTENSKRYDIRVTNGYHMYKTSIFKSGITVAGSDWNQTQNDADRVDFETNYKDDANGLEKTAIRIESEEELNVNVQQEAGSNKKLRYDTVSNISISTSSFTTIYSYSGSGHVYGAYFNYTNKEMYITVTIDGEDVVDELFISDLPKGQGANENFTPFISRISDTELAIQLPEKLKYDSSVVIKTKAEKNNKKLAFGYVVLSKVS